MESTAAPRRGRRLLINLGSTLLFALLYFYLKLPALNLHDTQFYIFLFWTCAFYVVMNIFTGGLYSIREKRVLFSSVRQQCKIPLLICAALVVVFLLGLLVSSPIFRARAYTQLIDVQQGDFAADIHEISYDQIPMLDRDSAMRLGDRKLGELSDMVSQFEVSPDYSQINYQNRPVRVTPLEYGDIFKWFNNRSDGLPAYLVIDMVTQNVQVVRLEEGMKYSDIEHFSRNIMRHLRFNYPTFLFDTPNFEIDEEGHPYWICPRIVKTIGLFGGTDVRGAVIVDAITGECQYYEEEVPSWIDRVYSADLIIEQYDYYGTYINGFFNSLFGQKDVTVTTDGYNYIAQDDDVYVYTGITSVSGDESNIGFILTNQRTKETHFYPCAGAEEYSAMSSAEGIVQHLNYEATFPLLLNVADQPTYFIPLKDNAGLVKMYAMVNVQQYNIVATASTVSECESQYLRLLRENQVEGGAEIDLGAVTGQVADIRSSVIDGNTYYYFRLEGETWYYTISAADYPAAAIVSVGDTISLQPNAEEGVLRSAGQLEVPAA